MGLQLHVLSPSNPQDHALIPAIARTHLAAWLSNSLYKTIYYGPPSSHAGIIEANRQRHMDNFTTNPSSHFAVVFDDAIISASDHDARGESEPETEPTSGRRRPTPDQAIAWVKYDVFASAQAEEERKDTGERAWPAYTNLALVNKFWDLIVQSRQRCGKTIGPHVSVDLLATDPAHHRRGAGKMLMQHVADQADQLGLPTTLEASPDGLRLYTSVGFVAVDEFWVDLLRYEDGRDKGDEWAMQHARDINPGEGPGWYKQVVMLRQPRCLA